MPAYQITVDDPDLSTVYYYPEVEGADFDSAAVEAARRAYAEDPRAGDVELDAAAARYCYEGEPKDQAEPLPKPGEAKEGWW